jgi:hypothetical protein
MKNYKIFVQQWENEKCGPNNTLSKFKYSLHKSEYAARQFITNYQKNKKVIRVNDIEILNVDEKTHSKVISMDKKGKTLTANNFEKVTLFHFN